MAKMNKTVKNMWVRALCSGKYKQCEGCLRDGTGSFCCLGVLCDLHRKTAKSKKYCWSGLYYLGNDMLLPVIVAKWAGLPVKYNDVSETDVSVNGRLLSTLNDKGVSFQKIANFIKKGL